MYVRCAVLSGRDGVDALADSPPGSDVNVNGVSCSCPLTDSPRVVQLAARIAVSNLHKNTLKSFSET